MLIHKVIMSEEHLSFPQFVIRTSSIVLGIAWVALIGYNWVENPLAIGTFMFQFLHVISFYRFMESDDLMIRAGTTAFFLATDTLSLILRILSPILPMWSAIHILSVIHSALVLLLAIFQAFVAWKPIIFPPARRCLIS